MYETILLEKEGGVATISLNRPKVLNAFNGALHEEIYDALNSAAADDEARCIVLRGEGKGFSAGVRKTARASRPSGFIARRTLPNAAVGSAKNMTPKRENTRSKRPGSKA